MAGLILGKLCFGKDAFHYGLELCLSKAGRKAYAVTTKTAVACDVILVTAFWYMDAFRLERFIRESGLINRNGSPIIIVGGMQATMTPHAFLGSCDYVFMGDADDHLGKILDQIEKRKKPESQFLWDGKGNIPVPSVCAPSAFSISKGGNRDVTRIEIARGCKFKCKFCALSGLKPYREVPFQDLSPVIEKSGRFISCFAPERTYHSEWNDIQEKVLKTGKKDLGQDVRLEHLSGLIGNTATIGLEGLSERLRKSIGKNFSDDKILSMLGEYVSSRGRIAMISSYFIADLPGETEEDWASIWSLFEKIERADWSRFMTLKPVLNPLSPKPFTPMEKVIIRPFIDYAGKWKNLLRKGGAKQWGFRVVDDCRVWGPYERIKDIIIERGKESIPKILRSLPLRELTGKPPVNESLSVAMRLLKTIRKFGLTEEILGVENA